MITTSWIKTEDYFTETVRSLELCPKYFYIKSLGLYDLTNKIVFFPLKVIYVVQLEKMLMIERLLLFCGLIYYVQGRSDIK